MKLSLDRESAAALREFAASMPVAVENILESTQRLFVVYQSVSENLGIHEKDFYDMLAMIKKAQEESAEAIETLPQMLNRTADKIDDYISRRPRYLKKR